VEAASGNPLALLHLGSSPALLSSLLRRHGPLRHAAELLAALRVQLAAVARAQQSNATQLVVVEQREGSLRVSVDDTLLPAHVARALEHWIQEMLGGRAGASANASGASANASGVRANGSETRANGSRAVSPRRRLLFLQELVLAVERGVREGWADAERLHQAYSQSMSQVLSYDYKSAGGAGEWPPGDVFAARECEELQELLRLVIAVSEGVLNGWRTLTHERDQLQRRPADSLRDAWPKLLHPEGEDAVPDAFFAMDSESAGDDVIAQWSAGATGATLRALSVEPRVIYDTLYSLASAANASFTCPYHAVQTCSTWRVRLWQAVVIVGLVFSVVAFFLSAFGLSFLNGLLIPFFGICVLQLCYG
jgi:hypothetical protein